MFASFHSKGTTPAFNDDKWNTFLSGMLICSPVSISTFLAEFHPLQMIKFIRNISIFSKNVVLKGDFNIDLLKRNSSNTLNFFYYSLT